MATVTKTGGADHGGLAKSVMASQGKEREDDGANKEGEDDGAQGTRDTSCPENKEAQNPEIPSQRCRREGISRILQGGCAWPRMAKKNHGETWIEWDFVNESVSIVEIVRPMIVMIHGYIINQQGS
jgi:hypothetical protein